MHGRTVSALPFSQAKNHPRAEELQIGFKWCIDLVPALHTGVNFTLGMERSRLS